MNDSTLLERTLTERLRRPQRHRLLQGYPAMPQMVLAAPRVGDRSDGIRSRDGALTTRRTSQQSSLAILREQQVDPGPHWNRTPEMRERFETQVRPRNELTIASLEALLATPDPATGSFLSPDPTRQLIVGVIPHTQCTPKVEGCGFCTFPHDKGNNAERRRSVEIVREEITLQLENAKDLRGRKVSALYFGGGTANLAKPEQIERVFSTLAEYLDLKEAEVSLEGVASLFTSWFHAPLEMLSRLPVRQRRISMGIQTFDDDIIASMGRSGFGDERSITKLVRRARSMDITTSGDFLFNLPGQSQQDMLRDVDRAVDAGLDQICFYNLVLYEGLGTLWSKNPEKLAAMPDNETACANWLAVRQRLLDAGFVQSTLTNFERREVAESERAFRYEALSFSPETTDALGFGPMSLSMHIDPKARRAVKFQRSKDLTQLAFSGDDLFFAMEDDDYRLMFVTRSLAKGCFERSVYERFCGSEVLQDFGGSLKVLVADDLLAVSDTHVALTPRGMFFSDAVVATLMAEKGKPRPGAGIHTLTALSAKTKMTYDGMG